MRLTESSGDLSQISKLPDSQTDVATRDQGGGTALHCAAEGGHWEVVRLLLDRMEGADIATKDRDGRTASHCAAEGGHGVVALLLDRALEKESTSNIRGNANEDHDKYCYKMLNDTY